ncbi:MAG: hypothetical protein QOJ29_4832, partial [Thermoleophilaceae bacterium]|nr:hypothetical protein [Thermoleophilaceae bacterium]
YRWDDKAKRFVQIPFQVDEMFTRYLDNSASGFAIYSGEDKHESYAFDTEGFRMRKEDPADPCHALQDSPSAADPVKGLDDNDELVFMASDAGPQAPADATLPAGIEGASEVRVDDPTHPGAPTTYAYVMKARPDGPASEFNADNGYVNYTRDSNADTFVYSQSSYDSYGNAPKGHFMWEGKCVGATPDQVKDDPKRCTQQNGDPVEKPDQVNQYGDPNAFVECPQRHRPIDAATISTDRYKFRYDGRWLLTGLQISGDNGATYGPDLIDRWKARAFAQDPYSETPCCGYEDEDKNWGGSSNLLGEKSGPVRTIRETWGADSGTNVIRREMFYRDGMRQKNFLRVHVIPPADGIYAQWDFNAGKVTKFYNPRNPDGVAIDGVNDEQVGNFDDPCNPIWDTMPGRTDLDQGYRDMYRQLQFCTPPCDPSGSGQCLPLNKYHLSMDVTDPTFNTVNSSLDWSEVAGDHGTVVDRYQLDKVTDLTPGGGAQSVFAVPYYRDDSCFDDGTGTDPGPRVLARSDREPRTYTDATGATKPRQCWKPSDGDPTGSDKFFQGDIATHGLHILMIAESDNARQTVPLTEIVAEQRMVFLPGNQGNVGEAYGRSFEKPLVAVAGIYNGTQPDSGSSQPPQQSGGGNPPQQQGGDSTTTPPAGSNGGNPGGSAHQTPPAQDAQQVNGERIEAHTAVPCMNGRVRVTKNSIAGIRIGDTGPRAIKRLGRPTGISNHAYAWCVTGGGKLVALFSSRNRVQLVAIRRSTNAKLTYRADRKLRKVAVKQLLRSL